MAIALRYDVFVSLCFRGAPQRCAVNRAICRILRSVDMSASKIDVAREVQSGIRNREGSGETDLSEGCGLACPSVCVCV